MNRQIRRATEKAEKRQEREKAKRKGNRAARRAPARDTAPKKTARPQNPKRSGFRRSGRFAGLMALVTTALILMGPVFRAPNSDPTVLDILAEAGLFLFFGYFTALWLLRSGVARALAMTVTSGIVLATTIEAAQFVWPTDTPEPLMIFLAAPLVVVGAFLARFTHQKTQNL